MLHRFSTSLAIAALLALVPSSSARAGDLKITIPRHSELTPVQRLNREGVEAVRKHQYEKAQTIFLKAYLYDPADPFTLNNLGYIAEMQGQLQRALQFYQLAAKQGTGASIDRSNTKALEGKPISDALNGLSDGPMRVNHINVQAVGLLSESRNSEAEQLLQQAYAMDPRNAFTLNNLGVAKELTGDYDEALQYFDQAAKLRSSDTVVVTLDRTWRGKSVSEMAADSAKKLEKRIRNVDSPEQQAALLAVRGVSATNRNDWKSARADFLKAYSLNPNSSFSLNNLGYVSERDGDLETAHFFYTKAQQADDANTRVGLASNNIAEGQRLNAVATDSNDKVGGEIDRFRRERQAEPGNVELERRDGSPVEGSQTAPQPRSPETPAPNTAPAPENTPPNTAPAPNSAPPANPAAPAPNPSAPQNPPQ